MSRCWSLALFGLIGIVLELAAAPPVPRADFAVAVPAGFPATPANWGARPFPTVALQDPFTVVNGQAAGEDNSPEGEKAPPKHQPAHIRDNAFLVEEAANQEAGVVQHIFNWVHFWDRTPEGRTRDFGAAYTMEIPLGSQDHQFSFTAVMLSAFEYPNEGTAAQTGGVGDTFLNYRYQLLADDDFLWCAPRVSLIVPTGDKRFGLGNGQLGYQFNLPISRYGEQFDCHFNVGATLIPRVSAFLPDGQRSSRQDLRAYNLGASTFWKPQTNLHFFVEALALWFEEINDEGFREEITQVFINPGVRYAVCQFEEVEWVLGVSVPVGLTRDSPNIGLFVYMSIEHQFRKVTSSGE